MSEGEIHIGEYELRNCVATGNVSQIWEVVERGGSQHFAMKLLLPEALQEGVNKRSLKHEFNVGKAMDHPNIIRFYKLNINRDHGYFIMDYFRAASLKTNISSSLTDVQVRFGKLVESLCLALTSMHDKGWLHHDIKPENILMNRGSEVRLIDFSLSCKAATGLGKMLGKLRKVQGTRTYIAPETLQKKKPTFQTDMYSLGVTLYEALTGQPPFTGLSPNDLLKKHILAKPDEPSFHNPNVTPECDQFILRLLNKKPEDRPKDMNEVYAEFRNLRVFKEAPDEIAARKAEEAETEKLHTVDQRLDSRLDAERTEKGIKAPPRKKKKLPTIKPKEEPPAPAPAQPPMPQPYAQPPMYPPPMPAYPQMPPGYMPQQPGMYQPQMPYPQPMPGQPAPYPQQPYGQPTMPQQPGHPPGTHPQQPQPPVVQPQQPQQPVAQPPQPQQPAAQKPADPQPASPAEERAPVRTSRPQAPPVPKDVPEDIEAWDELPDFE